MLTGENAAALQAKTFWRKIRLLFVASAGPLFGGGEKAKPSSSGDRS
jgi:hypothetical protein